MWVLTATNQQERPGLRQFSVNHRTTQPIETDLDKRLVELMDGFTLYGKG